MAQEEAMPWLLAVRRRRRSRMNRCRSMVVAQMRWPPLLLPPPPVLHLPAPPPPAERQLEFFQLLPKKRAMIMDHAEQNEYCCNICGKIYTSYYALGGHKAQHSRRGEGKPSSPKPKRKARPRRCQVKCPNCDRVFSSPQGLGGHKRHCKGRAQVAAPLENEPGPSGKVLMFDLNAFPPPEEDEIPSSLAPALPWYGCGV